jgi:hypothetical protein
MNVTHQKDLISEILLNPDFDWAFASNNESKLKRPDGDGDIETVFVASQHLYEDTSSRITIIQDKNDLHLIAQLFVDFEPDGEGIFQMLFKFQEIWTDRALLNTIDLDGPYYNIEWHFPITKEFWKDIEEKLKTIQIPLFPLGELTMVTRVVWIQHGHDYLTFRWELDHPQFDPIKTIMDSLLNYALERVHLAYRIEPKRRDFIY